MTEAFDPRTTNQKIADLMHEQTFAERMELADWLRDTLNDAKAEMDTAEGFASSDIAGILELWADAEVAGAGEL